MRSVCIVVTSLVLLTACESTKDMGLRTMAGGGFSSLGVDVSGVGNERIDGHQASVRVEVTKQPEYMPNMEVGLRFLGGFHGYDQTENGLSLDLDTWDLGAAVVFRPFVDLGETGVRLYAEGFVGYRHYWGDARLGDSTGTISSGKDDDGGVLFGAGLGTEIKMTKNGSLLLGLEWARHLTGDDGVDLDMDDFSALVGWSIKF